MNSYNFNHLYYFYVIAKLGSITQAALHLNTSQPSLSIQMKKLEHAVDKSLFKKQGRTAVLSDAGRDLYTYCRRAFEVFEEMSDHMKKKKNSMGVRLTLGITSDVGRPFITDLVSELSQKYKAEFQPLINLISLEADKLIEMSRAGEIDILVTSKAPIDGQIHIHEMLSLPVLAFANKNLISTYKNKSLEQILKDEDTGFVLPSRLSPLRQPIDLYFQKKKIIPKVTFQSNIISSVVRASSQGLGITFLPKAYVTRELKSQSLFQLRSPTLWNHKIMVVSNKETFSSEKKHLMKALTALLMQTAKSFDDYE